MIKILFLGAVVGEEIERQVVGRQCPRGRLRAHSNAVSLHEQLALGDFLAAAVYVSLVMSQRYDMTDFKLVRVVIEHQKS
jgi:hypothetical protein